jgi:hypothetical protein
MITDYPTVNVQHVTIFIFSTVFSFGDTSFMTGRINYLQDSTPLTSLDVAPLCVGVCVI